MPKDIYNRYYKYAFLSAFTTIPSFRQPSEFFKDNIEPIFRDYKTSLNNIQDAAGTPRKLRTIQPGITAVDEIEEIVYTPVPYYLFGDFDLAIFSLIDDFGFATKQFRPSSASSGFKYQVNTGMIPMIETTKNGHLILDEFEKKHLPGFFSGTDFYPFTGIALVKLNNAMLVGTGQDFITAIIFYLITFLDKETQEINKNDQQLFYILNESLGWNELTIHFFGNTLRQMQEIILKLRSKRVADIITFFRNELSNDERYDKNQIESSIIPMLEKINTDSLMTLFTKEGKPDYQESHPIIATSITYGFHAGFTEDGNLEDIITKKITDKRLLKAFKEECAEGIIDIGWKIKPGHEQAAHDLISAHLNSSLELYKTTQTGKYPFIFPEGGITVMEYLKFIRVKKKEDREQIHKNIIKFKSRIEWKDSKVTYTGFNADRHYNYTADCFVIPSDFFREVEQTLRIHPLSHTLKDQIENLIINYNDAINDPMMYSYFMGLKQSLESFLEYNFNLSRSEKGNDTDNFKMIENIDDILKSAETIKKDTQVKNILPFLQNWNKAYWNRYFHSYYFTEINDFNIEHHGGIQQILFAYDSMYKLMAKRIYGEDSTSPFVNVQGNPTITSTQWYMSINFNHLFRPVIFACECVHEAANHIIPLIIANPKFRNNSYSFLLNPNNEKTDPWLRKEYKSFDQNIREYADARDEYEGEYIENLFGINTLRQIITDYFTYRLAYEIPEEKSVDEIASISKPESAKRFYNCHWFIFLMNTELYSKDINNEGAWFFREENFKEIFIRFNLMFLLFYNYGEKELEQLNEICPSIELAALWKSRKSSLLKFVIRLGKAIKKEFDNRITPGTTKEGMGFETFHKDLETAIIEKGYKDLQKKEREIYDKMIDINFEIIRKFYETFEEKKYFEYNIIIRKSKSHPKKENPINTNVEFLQKGGKRSIFLDPKGNIFSTSPIARQTLLDRYMKYIKRMRDYSLKIALLTYEEEIDKFNRKNMPKK